MMQSTAAVNNNIILIEYAEFDYTFMFNGMLYIFFYFLFYLFIYLFLHLFLLVGG